MSGGTKGEIIAASLVVAVETERGRRERERCELESLACEVSEPGEGRQSVRRSDDRGARVWPTAYEKAGAPAGAVTVAVGVPRVHLAKSKLQ